MFNIVAQAARAELPEISQVFAQLGGFDAGRLGQGFTGDGADAVALKALERTEIDRKPVNGFAWNFCSETFLQVEEDSGKPCAKQLAGGKR